MDLDVYVCVSTGPFSISNKINLKPFFSRFYNRSLEYNTHRINTPELVNSINSPKKIWPSQSWVFSNVHFVGISGSCASMHNAPDLRILGAFLTLIIYVHPSGCFIFISFYFAVCSIYTRTCTVVTHPFASATLIVRDNPILSWSGKRSTLSDLISTHFCLGIYLEQLKAYPRVERWMCLTRQGWKACDNTQHARKRLVMCWLWPEARSQAKPGQKKLGQAGPGGWPEGGFWPSSSVWKAQAWGLGPSFCTLDIPHNLHL